MNRSRHSIFQSVTFSSETTRQMDPNISSRLHYTHTIHAYVRSLRFYRSSYVSPGGLTGFLQHLKIFFEGLAFDKFPQNEFCDHFGYFVSSLRSLTITESKVDPPDVVHQLLVFVPPSTSPMYLPTVPCLPIHFDHIRIPRLEGV